MRHRHAVQLILIAGLLMAGCSRDVAPTLTGEATVEPPTTPLLAPPADTAVLGALNVQFDPATGAATATPLRASTAYGDNYWLNATGFLDGVPCSDCFGLDSVHQDVDGHAVLTIRARHPFAPGDPGLPISGKNRLDLHVFDAAVLVGGDLGATAAAFSDGAKTIPSRLVLNAAGYSGLLTSVVSTLDPTLSSTAFPYVLLNEDRTTGNWASTNPNGFADLQNPSGHNIFPMGADVTTDITLGTTNADGPQSLTLLFTCSYGASVHNRTERLNPVYPLPEFNAKAPWRVSLDIPVGTNVLAEGEPTSTAAVEVRVWDWQQGAAIDASLTDIGAVRSPSDVASVELTVPGILSAPLDLGTPVSGTGPLDDPLVFSGLILNQASAAEGDDLAAVVVRDNRAPSGNSGGQTDALSSTGGTTIDPVLVTAYATYQIATVHVGGPTTRTPISIDITPTTRQLIAQGAGGAVTFTAMGTFATAPLTEDVTATCTWNSSAADVGSFTSNILTGIGMGTTTVTASVGVVVSNSCAVIVKPVEFLSALGKYVSEADAHQTSGEVYVVENTPNAVAVYNDAGILQRGWPILESEMDTVNMSRAWGITINETAGEIFVNSGWYKPNNHNVVVYTPSGTYLRGMTIQAFLIGTNQTITGLTVMDDGTLWHADFLGPSYVPFRVMKHDPAIGVSLGGFSPAALTAPIGADDKGTYLYIADPGGRSANSGVDVIDMTTQTVVASMGNSPAGTNQDDQLAVDRDGFIHVTWSGNSGSSPMIIQVFEFVPPSTLSLLYQYQPLNQVQNDGRGICVSRPNNVVCLAHDAYGASSQGRLTWFQ
ncbi:MAG: hypothetical protein ABI743_08295 [bacterium]